jgi:hypothetical protein
MPNCTRFLLSAGCFALGAGFSAQPMAQVSVRQSESSSCRKFAQEFYDWYRPVTKERALRPAWYLAMQRKPEAFNQDLLRALKIDSDASARAKGELVGLDFVSAPVQ